MTNLAEPAHRRALAFNALSVASEPEGWVKLSTRLAMSGAALDAAGLDELMAERDRLQKALEAQAAMVIPAQVNAIRGVAAAMLEVGAIGALGYRMMQMTADRIGAMTQASVEATQIAQEALDGGSADG